jgi:uncharacterized repeat protein (TIGR01451 family)
MAIVLTLLSSQFVDNVPEDGFADVGEQIEYTFSLENDGFTDLTGITFSNPRIVISGFDGNLAAGEIKTVTGRYTLDVTDVDNAEVTIVQSANAGPLTSNLANDTEGLAIKASLAVEKTALRIENTNGNTVTGDAGDRVIYRLDVRNTSPRPVVNVTLEDIPSTSPGSSVLLTGLNAQGGLDSNGTASGEYRYLITQSDLNSIATGQSIFNTASAKAFTSTGKELTATSTITITLPLQPNFTIVKIAGDVRDAADSGEFIDVNQDGVIDTRDRIKYTYQFTNTGNLPLSNIQGFDDRGVPGGPEQTLVFTPGTLAPGQTATATYEAPVTQLFLDRGSLTNTVRATATPLGRLQPLDFKRDNERVTITNTPNINVTKLANPILINNAKVGDLVQYSYTLNNPGPVSLLNVNLVDDNGTPGVTTDDVTINAIGTFRNGVQITGAPGLTTGLTDIDGDGQVDDLAVGATTNATYTGALTQAAIDKGFVTNIVVGTGTDRRGRTVTDQDTATVTIDAPPKINVTKVANPTSITNPTVGAPIQYSYTLTNPGPVSLLNVNLVDDNGTPGVTTDDVTIDATGSFRNGIQIAGASGLTTGLTDIDGDGQVDDLAVGATTTATYTGNLTQAIIDRGFVTNIVVGKGTDSKGNTVTDNATANVIVQGQSQIDVTKAANPTAIANAKVGDPIEYSYTLKNPGPVTLFNVNLVDDNGTPGITTDDVTINATGTFRNGIQIAGAPGLTGGLTDLDNDGAADDLAVGATTTATYTGTVTQKALEDGFLNNVVVGSGVDPRGNTVTDNAPASVTLNAPPKINVTKVANPLIIPNPTVGAPIQYTYTLTNPGPVNLLNVNLVDDNGTPGLLTDDVTINAIGTFRNNAQIVGAPGLTGGLTDIDGDGQIDDLAVGATTNATYTGALTQAAIDEGSVTNIVVGKGTDSKGNTVTDNATAKVTLGNTPRIDVTKVANPTSINNAKVGDPITYTYTLTNPGPVTLFNVNLVDDNGTPGLLSDDVTIDARGAFRNGVQIAGAPGLTGGLTDLDNDGAADDLAVGATTNATYTGTVTQKSLEDGFLNNVVVGRGVDSRGNPVTDDAPASVTLNALPKITVTKAANPIVIPNPTVGAPIQYTYTLTNPGPVNLLNVNLVDDNGTPGLLTDDVTIDAIGTFRNNVQIAGAPGLTGGLTDIDGDGQIDDLAVGATTNATYTGALTQAAIDEGSVTNIVVGKGTDSKGNTVTDNATAKVTLGNTPRIDVTKAANPILITNAKVGDPVTYTYTLTNPGPVSLFNVNLVDDNGTPSFVTDDVTINATGTFRNGAQIVGAPGLTGGLTDLDNDGAADDLAVGATTNATYTGALTQKALDDGFVTNIVTGKGTDSKGTPVTDTATAKVDVTKPSTPPKLKLVKTAGAIQNHDCDPNPTPGDTVTYTYEITNLGEVPVYNLILQDDNGTPNLTTDDFTIAIQGLETLDATGTLNDLGVGKKAVGYYTKTLTAEDICNCYFTNVGTVTGSGANGQTVTAQDDETIVFCPPSIHLEKCAELDLGADCLANPGDVIKYKFRVTNTGGIPLNTIAIDDPFLQSKNVAITFAKDVTTLKPGESVEAFATYKITQADIDHAKVYNKATVYGNPFYGDPKTRNDDVKDHDDATVCIPQHAKVHVDKVTVYGNQRGDGLHIPVGGDFYWEYKIVNKGNVSLRGIELTDHLAQNLSSRNIINRGNNDDVLDVGETWTYRFAGKAQKGEQCSDGQLKAYYKDCDGHKQYVHGKDWSSYTGKHPEPICPPDPCEPQKQSGTLPQNVVNKVVDYLKTWKHSNSQQWNGSTQQQIADKLQEHFSGQQLHFSVSTPKSPLC